MCTHLCLKDAAAEMAEMQAVGTVLKEHQEISVRKDEKKHIHKENVQDDLKCKRMKRRAELITFGW